MQRIRKTGLIRSSTGCLLFFPLFVVQYHYDHVNLNHSLLGWIQVELQGIHDDGISQGLNLMKQSHDRRDWTDTVKLHGSQLFRGGASRGFADRTELDSSTAGSSLNSGARIRSQG